jgi:hypothetical protein
MSAAAAWQRYPYVAPWGDPHWFTFPSCDGDARRLGVQTYFVDGFLRGARTGTEYAFLTVFTDARILERTHRFSFFSLALFDCTRRRYGTSTDYDFPHVEAAGTDKLGTAPEHLDLRYAGDAGVSTWGNQRAADGSLRPFAWTVELRAVDHHGARMELVLDIEAQRPPAPLGGPALGGEMMFLGAERTFSYFQSGLRMSGRLTWGDVEEEVAGEVGWIDRQWAEDDFAKHQDPESSRYRNEWRVMQFDNGWDLSCFHQYQRDQRNAVVPWTGVSAQGPGPEFAIRGTHRVELITPEFIRSPGVVRGLMMLSEGPRWFPHRYRLLVPEWDMDIAAEPLTDAPAHAFPIEWWSGPVRLEGRLFGERVRGLGFDERSCPRVRGFEIAAALKEAATHGLDASDARAQMLSYRAWEIEALALRGAPAAAAAHHARYLPDLVEGAAAAAPSLPALADDLLAVLHDEQAKIDAAPKAGT